MRKKVSATEARVHFGELMKKVTETDGVVVVYRSGVPQVAIISAASYDRLKRRQTKGSDWTELLQRSKARIASELGGKKLKPAEQMIREMRGERDRQLMGMR